MFLYVNESSYASTSEGDAAIVGFFQDFRALQYSVIALLTLYLWHFVLTLPQEVLLSAGSGSNNSAEGSLLANLVLSPKSILPPELGLCSYNLYRGFPYLSSISIMVIDFVILMLFTAKTVHYHWKAVDRAWSVFLGLMLTLTKPEVEPVIGGFWFTLVPMAISYLILGMRETTLNSCYYGSETLMTTVSTYFGLTFFDVKFRPYAAGLSIHWACDLINVLVNKAHLDGAAEGVESEAVLDDAASAEGETHLYRSTYIVTLAVLGMFDAFSVKRCGPLRTRQKDTYACRRVQPSNNADMTVPAAAGATIGAGSRSGYGIPAKSLSMEAETTLVEHLSMRTLKDMRRIALWPPRLHLAQLVRLLSLPHDHGLLNQQHSSQSWCGRERGKQIRWIAQDVRQPSQLHPEASKGE
ncbi:hypothetical protein CONPUDRAFT_77737 [Coniophora puteana RWD-64-598 SS2]|uniref:Uncharacterized protein n=1 Tax=Coniophora puteana (strain RWD-64-598) TaxID=741705 RepID=A0A5M3M829_CONPW|nr:uncharacterized protein CONPUDRAFT_77737 [Coniophora puteana RWD-64-598 SS2]EIW74950.1 hypothetical protein CONPUDRAFT_77737 [Coniophora puteana RWD-64-598 SS2]